MVRLHRTEGRVFFSASVPGSYPAFHTVSDEKLDESLGPRLIFRTASNEKLDDSLGPRLGFVQFCFSMGMLSII